MRTVLLVTALIAAALAILARYLPASCPLARRLRRVAMAATADDKRAGPKPQDLPLLIPQMVMFGDSITQYAWQVGGTGAQFADQYQRHLDVMNRGFGGYNTEWGLNVARSIFPETADIGRTYAELKLLTIWFGANDAVLPHRPQCVPLPKFKENLRTLHSMILSPSSPFYSPSTVVIFITPPPVDLEIRAKDCAARFPDWSWEKMDREVERTRSYAEAVKEVASQVGVESVDVWTAITKEAQGTAEGLGKYLVDGLHLTADGYSVVSRELWATISRAHPQLLPDNLPKPFPWWGDIDGANPASSFPHAAARLP